MDSLGCDDDSKFDFDTEPIYDEYDDEHVELPSCDAMLHRISCENYIGHFMFDNPLNLSYAMSEISHIASFQAQHVTMHAPLKSIPFALMA